MSDSTQAKSDEIDFAKLYKIMWEGKFIILGVTFISAILSIILALMLTNIYVSSALLTPAEEQDTSNLSGASKGLASLAGINLGAGSTNNINIALETLQSRKFIYDFINRRKILEPLMAVEGWDKGTNTPIYDKDVYDIETKQWTLAKGKPTDYEAYLEFMEKLIVEYDEETPFITVSVQFPVPEKAQEWVTWLVEDINENLRQKQIESSRRSILYLREQLNNTEVSGIRNIFFQLIEEQLKKALLAETRQEFSLQTIDPAIVPEKKVSPKRALIVILGTIFGGLLSLFVIYIRRVVVVRRDA